MLFDWADATLIYGFSSIVSKLIIWIKIDCVTDAICICLLLYEANSIQFSCVRTYNKIMDLVDQMLAYAPSSSGDDLSYYDAWCYRMNLMNRFKETKYRYILPPHLPSLQRQRQHCVRKLKLTVIRIIIYAINPNI